ncbi:hypothetical protein [Fusobacterium perfoetens]|uniref:hypothetical protein n=1 Tax=Fusobacterium perfoetens TaxID=852 RepID=UPI0004854488|nr:hypothetical protein [Fusobacterium perfoetens]
MNEDLRKKLIEKIKNINATDKDIKKEFNKYQETKKNYEIEFKNKTKLNELDTKLLFLGVFLQIARQFFIDNNSLRFSNASEGDKIPDLISKQISKKTKKERYAEILLGSVPYDATKYLTTKEEFYSQFEKFSHGISGANHRYTTLGHDPLLGWIFGTVNIITNTLTKNNFSLESYTIKNMKIERPILISEVFQNFFIQIREDKLLLPVAFLKQGLHFSSDAFTKMGLPVPILNNISPEFAGQLLGEEYRIDFYSISRGVLFSSLISSIITMLHNFYYNETIDNRKIYEVRTKKIILYSNMISTTSNLIYTSITKNFNKLDIGGFIVTLYKFYKSETFIRKLKEEYVNSKLDKYYDEKIRILDNKIKILLEN